MDRYAKADMTPEEKAAADKEKEDKAFTAGLEQTQQTQDLLEEDQVDRIFKRYAKSDATKGFDAA